MTTTAATITDRQARAELSRIIEAPDAPGRQWCPNCDYGEHEGEG